MRGRLCQDHWKVSHNSIACLYWLRMIIYNNQRYWWYVCHLRKFLGRNEFQLWNHLITWELKSWTQCELFRTAVVAWLSFASPRVKSLVRHQLVGDGPSDLRTHSVSLIPTLTCTISMGQSNTLPTGLTGHVSWCHGLTETPESDHTNPLSWIYKKHPGAVAGLE